MARREHFASILKRCDERSRQCLWAVMETVADYRAKKS